MTTRAIRLRPKQIQKTFLFALLVILTSLNIFPIYWLVTTSFKPPNQLISRNLSALIPSKLTLENYQLILSNPKFVGYFVNSLFVAIATTLIATLLASLSGYALARLKFWGSRTLGRMVILTYIVPSVLIVIPLFMLIVRLGLQNTVISLIMAHVTFALPFSMWMMRGYFEGIPDELAEAAMVDGASRLGAFFKVVLPLAAPGLVATAMFSFILSWNEYLFALILVNDDAFRTLPVGIQATYRTNDMDPQLWAALMSASVISTIPVVLLFLLLQEFLVAGLTAGALKS